MDPLERDLRRLIQDLRAENRAQARQIQALAEAIAKVNAKDQRTAATIGPLGAGSTTDVDFTWPTPWPDASYGVYIELVSGPTPLGSLHYTLKAGSKTATGCTVTVKADVAVASVGVDVLGVRT